MLSSVICPDYSSMALLGAGSTVRHAVAIVSDSMKRKPAWNRQMVPGKESSKLGKLDSN
jgi:hypothetical protein